MSWDYMKSTVYILIATLIASATITLLFASTVLAGGEGRYEEKLYTENEWMYGLMLFSPNFDKEPNLHNLNVHSVVAVDTFSRATSGAWTWMHRVVGSESNDPWTHATYIDADIVPVGHRYNVQEFFDAVIMIRENTFWDLYDLLDSGWKLGSMEHDLFNAALTEDQSRNFFEPRIFNREQNGRIYEGIVEENVIYRIPTSHAYSFSYSDGLD